MKTFQLQRKPTHPGEILREEFLIPLGLTQTELATALKTTFRTINEIVNERRSVTPDMALRLARYFRTSPELWQNLQADYDLYTAKERARETLSKIKPHSLLKAA